MENLSLNSTFQPCGDPENFNNPHTLGTSNNWYSPNAYDDLVYREYYPIYTNWVENKSSIEKAFKIVQILIDKKLVEVKTVKEFIDLVMDISKEV